jgi:hypothetical protein
MTLQFHQMMRPSIAIIASILLRLSAEGLAKEGSKKKKLKMYLLDENEKKQHVIERAEAEAARPAERKSGAAINQRRISNSQNAPGQVGRIS